MYLIALFGVGSRSICKGLGLSFGRCFPDPSLPQGGPTARGNEPESTASLRLSNMLTGEDVSQIGSQKFLDHSRFASSTRFGLVRFQKLNERAEDTMERMWASFGYTTGQFFSRVAR